ncbi:MAG: TonB-dependent receptor [Bacteroidia bacterium]|nr:TonB-dependent receptor [Bacteroidia bacterium]
MTSARLHGLVSLLLVFSLGALGQNTGVWIEESFENKPLKEVFELLGEKYDVDFTYGHKQVEPYRITAKVTKQSVPEMLEKILSGTDLDFYEAGKNSYVIQPNDNNIEIKGIILSQKTGRPIQGAAIASLRNRKIGMWVGKDGRFSLLLKKASHRGDTLVAYDFQHHAKYIYLDEVLAAGGKFIYVQLSPMEYKLDSVNIKADSKGRSVGVNGVSEEPQSITMEGSAGDFELDPSKLGFLVGLGGADILRTVQTLPGVSSLNEDAGNFNIRGSASEENQVLFDGITIYNGSRFMGLIGSVNQEAVQKVSLHNSGYDARFGGRTGGVIEMEGKPLKSIAKSKSVKTGANVLNLSGFLEAPIKGSRASIMLAGRSSYPEIIQSLAYQRIIDSRLNQGVVYADRQDPANFSNATDPTYSFYDINGKINWLVDDKKNILSLSFIKSQDQFFYKNNLLETNLNQEARHTLRQKSLGASLNWKYYWNRKKDHWSNTRLVYSGINNQYKYFGKDETDESTQRRSVFQDKVLNDWSFQHHTVWNLDKFHRLETGLNIQRLAVNFSDSRFIEDTIQTKNLLRNESGLVTAAYAQDEWTPNSKFSIKYGGRYSYFLDQNRHMLAPRVSLKYNFKPFWRLVAQGGRYFQYLRQSNDINDLGYSENFWRLSGSDSLPILVSDHVQTGIAYLNKHWTVGLEAYAKRIDGINNFSEVLFDVLNYRYYARQRDLQKGGSGTTLGIDLYTKYEKDFYTGWLSYSISKTQYQFNEINEGKPFLADQDRRHLIKFVNILKWDRFKFSAVFTWMSGNPITSITSVDDIIDFETNEIIYRIPNLSPTKNDAKLPDYHRLDITSSWVLFKRNDLLGRMGFSIFNVYNRQNIRDWVPTLPSANTPNTSANSLEARNLLGISPNLFINLEF